MVAGLYLVCCFLCVFVVDVFVAYHYVLMRKILCSFHKLLRACSVCNACVSGWVLQSNLCLAT